MIASSILMADEELVVEDARCVDAPRGNGPLEVPVHVELVIPLAGVFERTVFRSPVGRAGTIHTADPSRIQLFVPTSPYRVAHPIGGSDRSLVIAIRSTRIDLNALPPDASAPPIAHEFARRLATAMARGSVDALTAGEAARHLVDACLARFDCSPSLPGPDRGEARQIRLEVAASLGERLTLPELGRRVGLSGWEAARRFRRATGTSIHRFRTALRVQGALERIEAGERDLTRLALDLGFADHSHLVNVLRRTVGGPPTAFRTAPSALELAALRTILQA